MAADAGSHVSLQEDTSQRQSEKLGVMMGRNEQRNRQVIITLLSTCIGNRKCNLLIISN